MVAVDTTEVGEHKGVVTVDSDGGSATIHVRAHVEPTPLSGLEPAKSIPSEAVPAASGRTQPSAQPKKIGQGSSIKIVHVSDISGKEADEQSLGRLVVHEHPKYSDLPVALEALPEEVEELQPLQSHSVTVEWIPPGARRGKRTTLTLDEFNLLARPGVIESAVQDALIAKHRRRRRTGGGGSPGAGRSGGG